MPVLITGRLRWDEVARAARPAHRPPPALRGFAHSFGFAICSAAHDRYQEPVLLTGFATGTQQEALHIACTTRLAGLGT
jgi:hypothetical protein